MLHYQSLAELVSSIGVLSSCTLRPVPMDALIIYWSISTIPPSGSCLISPIVIHDVEHAATYIA